MTVFLKHCFSTIIYFAIYVKTKPQLISLINVSFLFFKRKPLINDRDPYIEKPWFTVTKS